MEELIGPGARSVGEVWMLGSNPCQPILDDRERELNDLFLLSEQLMIFMKYRFEDQLMEGHYLMKDDLYKFSPKNTLLHLLVSLCQD